MPDDAQTPAHPKRVLIAGAGTAGRSLAADVANSGDVVVGIPRRRAERVRHSRTPHGHRRGVSPRRRRCRLLRHSLGLCGGTAFVRHATSRERVELAIVPRTYRVVSRERVSVADLTDIDVLDMVGRAPVKHDMVEARSAIAGRRIMVTGAAGRSAHGCRPVARARPGAGDLRRPLRERDVPPRAVSRRHPQLPAGDRRCAVGAANRATHGSNTGPTSCSTSPRTSMCRSCRTTRSRRSTTTSGERSTCSGRPRPAASSASSTSPPTRRSTPRMSWAPRSASAS